MWRIHLFGGLQAQRGDQTVTRFRTQKSAVLLAYLAYYLPRNHPREALIELLWPECEPRLGRNNLSRELSWLRDLLEPPGVLAGTVLGTDRASVRLQSDAVTTDLASFETALKAAERAVTVAEQAPLLVRAVEQYQGELLVGYYDGWILGARQWLAERYHQALRHLMVLTEQTGEVGRSVDYARRWVNADPLCEEAHHELIRLLAAGGHPAAALRQYGELERLLQRELEVLPAGITRDFVHDLERQTLLRPSSSPSAPPPDVAPPPHGPAEASQPDEPLAVEPVGGAMPVGSPFYLVRPTDGEFRAAIARQDSLVLVKGARQMGKSSLLARGLQQARETGARVVLTDLQTLNASQLETVEAFLLALAQCLAAELDLDVWPQQVWKADCGPNMNFELYLRRQVLGKSDASLVWGLDEVDRLFPCPFGSEVFGLFRSWHNRRYLDPAGPWSRLSLAMVYATEAHLFITDLNQSPFNVGTRLTLADFTLEQVAELNGRYGSPLRGESEVRRFFGLLGGQPYLVQRGLHDMVTHGLGIGHLQVQIGHHLWMFRDHLQRILVLLANDPELCDAVRGVLQGRPCPTTACFYRLRSAGVLAGETAAEARPRCQLYAEYLTHHLL